MMCCGFILYRISEHSFHLKAANRLYLARSKQQNIFQSQSSQATQPSTSSNRLKKYTGEEWIPADAPRELVAELKSHQEIRLKFKDSLRLFLARFVSKRIFMNFCWRKKDKLINLYEQSVERIESELDVIKIIKGLKDLKILMKNSVLNPEVKYQIKHSSKYLIDLEDSAACFDL
mmetsp:Transcript_9208/g.15487  ORF Transcript_9208/g.15487 Transcript_9208/m.15487 type:complete len:175 (+) Transcript_9208:410-934(+)